MRAMLRWFVAAVVMAVVVWPVLASAAQAKVSLDKAIGIANSEERDEAYLDLQFQPDDTWKVGKVIAKKPYGVITRIEVSDRYAYELQVWRGFASRVNDSLLTKWDILMLDMSGKVIQTILDYNRSITDYFKASSQDNFQTMDFLEQYPWVNIQTDEEANISEKETIPADGLIDVYGIAPQDGSFVLSSVSGAIKPRQVVPGNVPNRVKPEVETELTTFPDDIKGHWAQNYIIDLMRRAIVQGYEDHSIRPDGVLTRAEFTVMLVRSLRMEMDSSTSSGFTDLKDHWSKVAVDTAVNLGLIIAIDSKFDPDIPISRLEMSRMLGNALGESKQPVSTKQPTLNDLQVVSEQDATTIGKLSATGIVSGDPDGKFRPNDSLTRAEACKVLSVLLQLK